MFECLMTIAFVCFADAESAKIDPGGLMRFANVRVGRAEVTIVIDTDNPVQFDRWRMKRACGGETCITYHKHCAADRGRVDCSYFIAERPFRPSLTIRAPPRRDVAEAERQVHLIPEGGGAYVSLALLSAESSKAAAQMCYGISGDGRLCHEAVIERQGEVAAFELGGPAQYIALISAEAARQGWRVEPVTGPLGLGSGRGWTVYAPRSAIRTWRLVPPTRLRATDLRAFLQAVDPLLHMGMRFVAVDRRGRVMEF